MPDARCARSLVCEMEKHTSIVTTVTPERSGIPRAMVLRFPSCSSRGPGFLAPVIPEKLASQELDASVGASEPHDFAVRRQRRSSCGATRVHRIPRSTFVTMRNAPPDERGTGRALLLFLPDHQAKYFLHVGWTGNSANCPSGKSVPLRHREEHQNSVGWVEPSRNPSTPWQERWVSLSYVGNSVNGSAQSAAR
jgi:hypothetical protein